MALQGANGRGLEAPEDGTRLVILIDALDELPSWLCVFITTRPEVDICDCSREREEHGGFAHFFFRSCGIFTFICAKYAVERLPSVKSTSLIVLAREPLEEGALQAMVGCERRRRPQAMAWLSVLFPIHDHKMKVNPHSCGFTRVWWWTGDEEELYI